MRRLKGGKKVPKLEVRVFLSEAVLEEIDKLIPKTHETRSEVVREIVNEWHRKRRGVGE